MDISDLAEANLLLLKLAVTCHQAASCPIFRSPSTRLEGNDCPFGSDECQLSSAVYTLSLTYDHDTCYASTGAKDMIRAE